MKICLVTRYFSMKNAGLGRVSSEIHRGLVQRGYEVKTISTKGASLPSYFMYTALEIPLRLPRNCDVYHILTPMEGIWIPKNKSIATFYDLIPITNPDRCGAGLGGHGLKNWIGRNYFQIACHITSNSKYVACISEQTRQDVLKFLVIKKEKIRVIRLGIREDLEPQNKRHYKLALGYLGQLDRRKRVDLLIKELRRSTLEASLTIAGMGVDEASLRQLAEGDKRIEFLGLLPDERLTEFYNSIDALIFPTWIEGYGLPPVEAMACKKPIVVLDDAIIPWEVKSRCIITKDLGLLFSSEKYLREQMAQVNLESNYLFAKSHSWDKCLDSYIELYKEIASE